MRALFGVTFWTGLLTILKMAVGFVITKFVAIYGGPTGLALLGQIQAIVTSFNGLVNAPVSNGIVRYTAEYHEQGINECVPWWRAGVKYSLCIYMLLLPLVLFSSEWLSETFLSTDKYSWLITVCVIFLPLTAIGTLINSIINGRKEYKKYVIVGMISTLLTCLILMFFIMYNNLSGALLSVCIQYSLVGSISIFFVYRQEWFVVSNFWGRTERKHLYGIAIYVFMAIVSAIAMPTSLLLIRNEMAEAIGWTLTGQWQAVWRISEVYLSVLTLALGVYYLPKLASFKKTSQIIREVETTSYIVLLLASVMAITVYLLRDYIILILFSREFLPARQFFLVQLIGDCIKLLNWVYSYPMLARGSVRWFVFLELFFAALFYLITFFLLSCCDLQVEAVLYSYVFIQLVCFVFLKTCLKHIIK